MTSFTHYPDGKPKRLIIKISPTEGARAQQISLAISARPKQVPVLDDAGLLTLLNLHRCSKRIECVCYAFIVYPELLSSSLFNTVCFALKSAHKKFNEIIYTFFSKREN